MMIYTVSSNLTHPPSFCCVVSEIVYVNENNNKKNSRKHIIASDAYVSTAANGCWEGLAMKQ